MLKQHGFSLLELTIVLAVFAIILSYSHQAWIQNHQISKSRSNAIQLEQIKQALLTHLQTHYYLPCPDTDHDGQENRKANGTCQQDRGALPFLELGGIGQSDVYGQAFHYATNTFSDSNTQANNMRLICRSSSMFARTGQITNELNLCEDDQKIYCLSSQCSSACPGICDTSHELERSTPPYFHRITPPLGTSTSFYGALRVCAPEASTCAGGTALSQVSANLVPLVVISFGANGGATWQDCANANTEERENCDGDRYFHQRPISDTYDDQLTWITIFEAKQALNHLIDWR
jgi:prepilin-type N-terminal cleavage/methylation domain-containing protein